MTNMKMVRRRVLLKNLKFLPEGRSRVINNWRRGDTVLCDIDIDWVQHKHGKYSRLIAD
jgi:hypothetical protein